MNWTEKRSKVSFLLVYGEHELSLPLHFEPRIEDQILSVLGRTFNSTEEEVAIRRGLATRIVDAVTAALDLQVAPPSDKQVKYAVAIARELRLQLSPEVLESRDAMAAFLEQHAKTYRRRKAL